MLSHARAGGPAFSHARILRALQFAFYDWTQEIPRLINGMLTSELVLKTQMESALSAARRIQNTLHPHGAIAIHGKCAGEARAPGRDRRSATCRRQRE